MQIIIILIPLGKGIDFIYTEDENLERMKCDIKAFES